MNTAESSLNVLLIEDNDEHALVIQKLMQRSSHASANLERVPMLAPGLKRIADNNIDVILLDLKLPDSEVRTALSSTLRSDPRIPVIVLSSIEDRDLARQAVHEGAQEFLCKTDLNAELLSRTIQHAIERKRNTDELKRYSRNQEALVALSQQALHDLDFQELCQKTCDLVRSALGSSYTGIIDRETDAADVRLRAGAGWPQGWVGWRFSDEIDNQFFTRLIETRESTDAEADQPTVIKTSSFSAEERFSLPQAFLAEGIRSGVHMVVPDPEGPRKSAALLAIYCTANRIFDEKEVQFLHSVVNILASKIRRHRLEHRLFERVQELRAAHKKKDEFIATLSHELRTPLGVILGYAEVLKARLGADPEVDQAVEGIERYANIEAELVSQALDTSQVVTGTFKIKPVYFTIPELIDEVRETMQFAASRKNVQLHISCDESLQTGFGDAKRIRQALWNLLSNAVKFTPKGGQVELVAERKGSQLFLRVSDTGIGMEPEQIDRVFDRFWQADQSTTRKHDGMGVGMALTQEIVHLHGGTIDVESLGPNRGTTFKISLPIVENPGPAEDSAEEQHTSVQAIPGSNTSAPRKGPLTGCTILVVDDQEDNLWLTQVLLQKRGAEVLTAPTAHDALKILNRRKLDVFVGDIGLPDMDGFSLIAERRKTEKDKGLPRLPSLALTAYEGTADKLKAIEAGFDEFLAKPIRSEELTRKIESLLQED